MIDLHCKGSPTSKSRAQAYLIIYGVSGFHPDVSKSVYDYPYILGSGKMVMQANLDMNNHKIINSPSLTASHSFVINGVYNRSKNSTNVLFSGEQEVTVPVNCKITKCTVNILDVLHTSYPSLTVIINSKSKVGSAGKMQHYDIDLSLVKGELIIMKIRFPQSGGQSSSSSTINKCVVSLLFEKT